MSQQKYKHAEKKEKAMTRENSFIQEVQGIGYEKCARQRDINTVAIMPQQKNKITID